MFSEITELKKILSQSQRLIVNHSGYIWEASFQWYSPTNMIEIIQVENYLGMPLPNDFKLFLTQVSNGAMLFHDSKDGQWGYEIYSIEKLVAKQSLWKNSLPATWQTTLIAFGELIGEANVLVFDSNRPTKDLESFAVLEGDAYESPVEWPLTSRSFHEWLDHLITAQGDKYWLWR